MAVREDTDTLRYTNQEEYLADIERVFWEDYQVNLSIDQTQKIGDEIMNTCLKFLQ